MKRIAVLVGSLRRHSINRRLAEALARLAEDRLEFDFIELSGVPMYNEDLWDDIPTSITRMKRQIEQADGVLFVSPEYNRSFTAVLKNSIDGERGPMAKTPLPESQAPSWGPLLAPLELQSGKVS